MFVEHVKTDDVAIRSVGAFTIRLEETGDHFIDVRRSSGCDAPTPLGTVFHSPAPYSSFSVPWKCLIKSAVRGSSIVSSMRSSMGKWLRISTTLSTGTGEPATMVPVSKIERVCSSVSMLPSIFSELNANAI